VSGLPIVRRSWTRIEVAHGAFVDVAEVGDRRILRTMNALGLGTDYVELDPVAIDELVRALGREP
jgi:hypothetical protein